MDAQSRFLRDVRPRDRIVVDLFIQEAHSGATNLA